MSDEEFFQFLTACREELAAKQAIFQRRIAGTSRWHYDMGTELLQIDALQFRMTVIGSYSAEYQSWLWAWANEDFPDRTRDASRQIQGLHARTGFQIFLDAGFGASIEDAMDFSALAVHELGAIAIFRCPSDGPEIFLAVHEPKQPFGRI